MKNSKRFLCALLAAAMALSLAACGGKNGTSADDGKSPPAAPARMTPARPGALP